MELQEQERLKVYHLDEAVKSMNRAANRLSLSIIVAALIIGGKFVVDTVQKSNNKG
jgi:hypothetical protein